MNDKRRQRIRYVVQQLTSCTSSIELIKDEEDYSRDNIPENLQSGEKYCTSEECSDKLEDALIDIKQVINALESI